jgi:hypothetical protein
LRERAGLFASAGRDVTIEMRRGEVVAMQRGQALAAPDVRRYPQQTSDHWLQLASEVRRQDLALERILQIMDEDLTAFVGVCNAR